MLFMPLNEVLHEILLLFSIIIGSIFVTVRYVSHNQQ